MKEVVFPPKTPTTSDPMIAVTTSHRLKSIICTQLSRDGHLKSENNFLGGLKVMSHSKDS